MSELQDLHAVELDILKAVDAICKKYDLTYTLYCGTLLGAIRHQGFIPWDDDIDLAMPLKDYRRFVKISNELPVPYVMVDWDNCKYYHLPWIRIFADGTTHMDPWEAIVDMHHGMWIDIYPVIGAARTKLGQKVQNKLIKLAGFFHSGAYHRVFWYEAGWYSKLLCFIPKWIRLIAGKLCMLLAVRDPEKSKTVGTIDAAPFEGKFEIKDLEQMTTAEFEGLFFPVPVEYDKLLHRFYGNYMELPPESERYTHGSKDRIIDANKDYHEYQKELLENNSREKYNKKTKTESRKRQKINSIFHGLIRDYKSIDTDTGQYIENQRFERDTGVDEKTGLLIHSFGSITNYLPIPVNKGDVIKPLVQTTEYCLVFYSKCISDRLIYTYTYAPESNWATFEREYSDFEFTCTEREVKDDGFIRLVVRGIDHKNKSLCLKELFNIEKSVHGEDITPDWITEEKNHLIERVKAVRNPGDGVFLLLTDTHYATGSNWSSTRESLKLAAEVLHPDALIHLGDFTDGLMPGSHTFGIGAAIISELKSICSRVFVCIGNHDKNRFRGNTDGISERDCAKLYLDKKRSWYYVDLPEKKLRLFFLDSFAPDKKERYGFSAREVFWLRRVLWTTPNDFKVVVFSHVPPLPEIHVWSDTIHNGEKMLRILESYHNKHNGSVLGWIHGHNHADQIWTKRAFPIIGIGCSKIECFPEHKPEGSISWQRKQGVPSQELWDVLIVHGAIGKMDFIRYGAGEDRSVNSMENIL